MAVLLKVDEYGRCVNGARRVVNHGPGVVHYNPGGATASASDREILAGCEIDFDGAMVAFITLPGAFAELEVGQIKIGPPITAPPEEVETTSAAPVVEVLDVKIPAAAVVAAVEEPPKADEKPKKKKGGR